jgi:hypothetical protein
MFKTQGQEIVDVRAKMGIDRGLDKVKNEANSVGNEARCGGVEETVNAGRASPLTELGRADASGSTSIGRDPPRRPFGCLETRVQRAGPTAAVPSILAGKGRAANSAMASAWEPPVGRDEFWAQHDAGPALDASETGRFTSVYGCSKSLQECQKVPESATLRGPKLGPQGATQVEHKSMDRR